MLIDPAKTRDEIVAWIREYFEKNGPGCSAVIGISGGKDSSVAAALCVEALGRNRVFGVLIPQGDQPDIDDSRRLVEALGIPHTEVNIGAVSARLCDLIRANIGPLSTQARVNLPARVRMTVLYAIAQCLPNGGRVVNTCNMSEDYVGYSTKFGDAAGDFAPLAGLLVHEVRQLGHALALPRDLVDKTPSDGLCGRSDEDNLGFSYDMLDKYILTGRCDDPAVRDKIAGLHTKNLHKLRPMPSYGASARSMGGYGNNE